MSEETKDSRLPPPAFPPGSRKHPHRNSSSPSVPATSAAGSDDDAFISPDDPIPARRDAVDKAFISPDDPIPDRADGVGDAFISPDDPLPERAEGDEEEAGVVTGMSYDPHLDPEELVTRGDPHVMELVEVVGKLAEALKRKGEAGLRSAPGMSRFDATLRSYCVGYLAGRRAEDEVDIGE